MHESSSQVTGVTHRTAGDGRRGIYASPEHVKPSTPYEDKVIPTLRNRQRSEGGYMQGASNTSADVPGESNDDIDNAPGATTFPSGDDAIAELNQAEMIEANQMMAVFDKSLVSPVHRF